MFKVFHQKNLEPTNNRINKWLTIDTNVGTCPFNPTDTRPYVAGYATFHSNMLGTDFIKVLNNSQAQTTFIQNSELIRNLTITEYLTLAQAIKREHNVFNKKKNKFLKTIYD